MFYIIIVHTVCTFLPSIITVYAALSEQGNIISRLLTSCVSLCRDVQGGRDDHEGGDEYHARQPEILFLTGRTAWQNSEAGGKQSMHAWLHVMILSA